MAEMKLKEWLAPVWQGGQIWEESVCFYEDASGAVAGGNLLYAPKKIEKITNHDGTVVYEEHKDYEVNGRVLVRTEDSRIPVLTRAEYCWKYEEQPWAGWLCLPGKEWFTMILPQVYTYQVLVTYETEEAWGECVPERQGAKLTRTYEKLESGKPLHIVFFGDSITAGWEASGADEPAVDMGSLNPMKVQSDRYPYMPVWAELLTRKLREVYPQAEITKDNLSSGGSTAKWGVEHVNELFDRVAVPDLVFLGFGMNCMWDPAEEFIGYLDTIMTELRKKNPECEFVLYPAMTANTEIQTYQNDFMETYEKALYAFAEGQDGVAVAPVNSMFRAMEARGKAYFNYTGNCVNHPNDFAIRLYGQTVWEAIQK